MRPDRMLAVLESSHGLVFSQRVLLGLVERGLTREEAYALVQRNAMRAWDEGRPLGELLGGRPRGGRGAAGRRARGPARPRLVHPPRPRGDGEGGRPVIDAGAVAGYPLILEGKVRQVREVDADRLLIVATDRISAYDWIMPTPIPDKGRVLTALSAFWFGRTADIVPNHLIETVGDRAMLVRRLRMLPMECVARGYLAGSGWRDYLETGAVCGHRLPRRAAPGRPAARADLHPGDEGRPRATT